VGFSLNEIEAMGKRATRGAGLPWGIAEEAGKAIRWLSAHGLTGVEPLEDVLIRHDERPYTDLAPADVSSVWQAKAGCLCPLITGSALCDRAAEIARGRLFELGETARPLLLAPYVAGAAGMAGVAIDLVWDDVALTLTAGGVRVGGHRETLLARKTVAVRCRLADHTHDLETRAASPIAPAPIDAAAWSRLSAFAQRTYAPATEASRRSGAGAGLTDNN